MQPHLGLESGVVRLVAYDDMWPSLFAAERDRINAALASHGLAMHIEHIGSTAVPGLAAKPVLDILAAPLKGEHVEPLLAVIPLADYEYRPLSSTPERHFFRRGTPRQFHLHLTPFDSDVWRDQLVFRDRLRADARLAADYAALKRELAGKYPRDRESYINGKTEFVRRVVALPLPAARP
jgi:GrpB-like predicted nucleotidyltransferase (UPF0157 family)